jgi:dipeptide/tripeptide permease
VTTPAQDAPFVLPAVAFNPARLSVICVLVAGLVTAVAGLLGHVMFGVFFAIGLALGLLNALLVRRAVSAITAEDHPLKKKMALNSATRLLAITAVGLTIAFLFKPMGLGVLFGLALFQVILVLSTSLPVMKKLREGAPGEPGQAPVSNDG